VDEVPKEAIPDFESWGIRAFTTTRDAGTFGLGGTDPVNEVMGRWTAVQRELAETARRLASIRQVHGTRVLVHTGGWEGWLRGEEADGHIASEKGIALAVGVADCVPKRLPRSPDMVCHRTSWRSTWGRQSVAAATR